MPVNIPTTNKPRIVVIGGGFGGLQVVRNLKSVEAQVVWIDKENYHTFQPLLYQVATSGLEPDSIAYPLRQVIKKQDNAVFRMTEVLNIKPAEKCIETAMGQIFYDFLVIAAGAKTNYFGMVDIQRNAIPMKSLPQALDVRSFILGNLEKAYQTDSVKERDSLMNFVIVGGGPTGVEMAGALGELKHHILPRDYPDLELSKMQIHIIEMQNRLLGSMSIQASKSAQQFLEKSVINIWLNTCVKSYDGSTLILSTGKKLCATTVIWTAGVAGAVIPGLKDDAIFKGNRIRVDQFNRVKGYPNIFAIGDIAAMITDKVPEGYPMLAPVAIQQGRHLAKNLKKLIHDQPLRPFVYRDLGVMATIGRNHAVCDLKFMKCQGVFGWFIWLVVHLLLLIGFRNKLVTFLNWAWSYFSYDRSLRLIIRPYKRNLNTGEQKLNA